MQFIPFEEPSKRPIPPETVQFSAPMFTPDAASAPRAPVKPAAKMAATTAVLNSFIREILCSLRLLEPKVDYPPKPIKTQRTELGQARARVGPLRRAGTSG